MCGSKFCSMKITQDVRDYAASLGGKEKRALCWNDSSHPEEARSAVSRDEAIAGMKSFGAKLNISWPPRLKPDKA